MNILYFSNLCQDTDPAIKVLDKEGVSYDMRDITLSLAYMKEFLKLRDSRNEFDDAKKEGYIGIPVLLMEDGSLRHNF